MIQRRAFLALAAATIANRGLAQDSAMPAAALAHPAIPAKDARELLMKDVDGNPVPVSDYAGRLVVLNLWGSWCPPCRREMPSISRLVDKVDPAKIVVVPLAFDNGNTSRVRAFYKTAGITNLPILMGDGQNLKSVLSLSRLPTTAILDKTGMHISTVAGEAMWDDDDTVAWLNRLAAK